MSTKKKASAAKKPAAKKTAKKRASASGKAAAKKTVKKALAADKRSSGKKSATKRSQKAAGAARRTAARVTAVQAPRRRRAIFIDVENTSSAAALFEVIDALKIDRIAEAVELFAVGNWRVVGQNVGRELAALGAKLVHSAPARGVRDWSDLWIAVVAGTWIARAAPGDVLEIVSNDRAFDAVGDAAAADGVVYRRIQHRRGAAASAAPEVVTEVDPERTARRRRRRPRRGRGAPAAAAPVSAAPAVSAQPHGTTDDAGEAHGASRDQMVAIVEELARGRSSPWVNLDVLEAALKRQGFQRPPNSPRLVTRLRRLKGFEVDSHGRVRLAETADA